MRTPCKHTPKESLKLLLVVIAGVAALACGLEVKFTPTPRPRSKLVMTNTPKAISVTTPNSFLLVPDEFDSIQAAIDSAQEGNTIIVSPGRYVENIDFKGKDITIRSTDPENPEVVIATIIDGDGRGSVVTIVKTSNAVLTGFTITNGKNDNGGGIYVEGSSSRILRNIITGNEASSCGGGIASLSNSSMSEWTIIELNQIVKNKVNSDNGMGGGICEASSASSIKNNTIEGNYAFGGGGLVVIDSRPVVSGNQINRNRAILGGGIYLTVNSSIVIEENSFNSNEAGVGGAIYIESDSTLERGDPDSNSYTGNGPNAVFCIDTCDDKIILIATESPP